MVRHNHCLHPFCPNAPSPKAFQADTTSHHHHTCRVHNRWLRTRFEQRLAVVTAADAKERQDAINREKERERIEAKEAAKAERERLKQAEAEGGSGSGKEKEKEKERDKEPKVEAVPAVVVTAASVPSAPPAVPRRAMEYLFFGEHPCMPGELDRVVEEGFRSAGQMTAMVGAVGC